MVQVVRKSPKYIKEVICKNCSSELAYTESEVITRTYLDAYVKKYIKCPCCYHEVTLSDSTIGINYDAK